MIEISSEPKVVVPEILEKKSNDSMYKINESKSVAIYQKAIQFTSDFSLNAQRLLRTVIALIGEDDKPGKVYTFSIDDYCKLFGLGRNTPQRLIQAGEELGKRFFLPDPYDNNPNSGIVIGWIDYLRIRGGIVTVRFQPELLGVYQKLKEKSYNLGNTKHFKVTFSFVFYEKFITMLGTESKVNFYMTIDEMRSFLNLGNKYVRSNGVFDYSNFNKRVLSAVFADINGSEIVDNPCNINFTYTERKAGRRVVGVDFQVWTVYTSCVEIEVKNPFYESLAPETKIYFDAAVDAGVDVIEVERAITKYSAEGFCKTMTYILTNHKNKGLAYWIACIRNGWVDNKSGNRFSFDKIERDIAFVRELHFAIRDFLFCLEERQLSVIFKYVCDNLQNTKPQLGEYMKRHESDLRSMLRHDGFMVFVYDEVSDIIKKKDPAFVSNLYLEYATKVSKGITIPKNPRLFDDSADKIPVGLENYKFEIKDEEVASKTDDVLSPTPLSTMVKMSLNSYLEGREEIVAILKSENIVDDEIIKSILVFDDDYIKKNIAYCVENYRNKKGQSDISGVIISACQKDYAKVMENRHILSEKEAEKEKIKEAQEKKQNLRNFVAQKDDMSDEEIQNVIDSSDTDELVKEEALKEIENRSGEKEIEEYRKYFFALTEEEQDMIVDYLKSSNDFFGKILATRTYEELWGFKMSAKLLVKAMQMIIGK